MVLKSCHPANPLMHLGVLVSELYFTGSHRDCQCLQSKVGQHFPGYRGRGFVHGTPKLCPHKSKPGSAGGIMNYRLCSGPEAVQHCLPFQTGRQDKVEETLYKSSSVCPCLPGLRLGEGPIRHGQAGRSVAGSLAI